MRILIACEYSGIVRDAFIARGHDAVSCDLLPTESPGPHIEGDARPLLRERWDMVIAHPPCTFLANSGVRWLVNPGGADAERAKFLRRRDMEKAADFFRACLDANAPSVAVENPVIHGHARLPKPSFTVQPWQFGHGECKRICFWTRGLPPLRPTKIVEGRAQRVANMAPGPHRQKERARFYPGIAAAMADQWGETE